MSKTQLKKELEHLDAPQLRDLLVEVYEARKEAKEYLDFFVNPDIEKLTGKYKALVDKETARVTRRKARPRTTRLKKYLKDFASFNPGDEYVAEMMVHVVERLCDTGSENWVKDSTQKSAAKHLDDTLAFIDSHELLDSFLPRIIKAVDNMKSGLFFNNQFKRLLQETIRNFSTADK